MKTSVWLSAGRMVASGAVLLASAGLEAAPALPSINTNNVIPITAAPYEAVGDGATDNTAAIQSAINAAALGPATNSLSGGTVAVPAPGVFLCGPLTLKSRVNLRIDAGATLRMLPLNLFTNYPPQSGNGQTYGNLLYAKTLSDLEISGSGTIDGQGADWWPSGGAVFNSRPYLIYFNSGCRRVLIQDVHILNGPAQLVVFKGRGGDITVRRVTESAPPSSGVANPSHNTDGVDLVGTNILVQDCAISVGDDNLALGSSGGVTAGVLVTNCAFGTGHGVSIGSHTESGVSNLTVTHCTFDGTDNGIRLKCDNDRGGVAMNLNYADLTMTNIRYFPILIYSYYNEYGIPTSITPVMAQAQAIDPVTSKTPIWRDITISNVTATVASSGIAGMIWGRTELPVTNVILNHVVIHAARPFDVYNGYAIQFTDSRIGVSSGGPSHLLYNAGITLTNASDVPEVVFLDGVDGANTLELHNSRASLTAADVLGADRIVVDRSTLSISNDLVLPGSVAVDFAIGTNASQVTATGTLTLNNIINLTAGSGFGPGTYTLFSGAGSLSGEPVLGSTPPASGYSYRLDASTPGVLQLVVSTPHPPEFGAIRLLDGSLVLSGSGGPAHGGFSILTSTNLALPPSRWSILGTSQFDENGDFDYTNNSTLNSGQGYYLIELP